MDCLPHGAAHVLARDPGKEKDRFGLVLGGLHLLLVGKHMSRLESLLTSRLG